MIYYDESFFPTVPSSEIAHTYPGGYYFQLVNYAGQNLKTSFYRNDQLIFENKKTPNGYWVHFFKKFDYVKVSTGSELIENPTPYSILVSDQGRGGLKESLNIDNFPAGFDVNNFPAGFDVNNFPTGFDVNNFPRGFAVDNFPRGFDVNNFPLDFGINNFPTEFSVNNLPPQHYVAGPNTRHIRPIGSSSEYLSVALFPFQNPNGLTVNFVHISPTGQYAKFFAATSQPMNAYENDVGPIIAMTSKPPGTTEYISSTATLPLYIAPNYGLYFETFNCPTFGTLFAINYDLL